MSSLLVFKCTHDIIQVEQKAKMLHKFTTGALQVGMAMSGKTNLATLLGFVVVVTIEISEPPCLSKFHAFGKMSVEKIVIYFLGKIPLLVKYFIFSSAKIISNRILNESN